MQREEEGEKELFDTLIELQQNNGQETGPLEEELEEPLREAEIEETCHREENGIRIEPSEKEDTSDAAMEQEIENINACEEEISVEESGSSAVNRSNLDYYCQLLHAV